MSAPRGWYPDPEAPGQERFWDGYAWTDESRPWDGGTASTAPSPLLALLSAVEQAESTALEPGPGAPTPSASTHLTASTRLGSTMSHVPAPVPPAGVRRPAPEGRRARFSVWSGMVVLIALVPIFVGSLGIVAPIAYGLHLVWPGWGAVIPFVVWCALAPLAFLPAAQLLTARVSYGCREPDGAERDRLDQPWRRALHRAAIPDHTYRLLVTDSAELNACTPTGWIVAVTSHSVRSLTPERLEAMLAHELAHRLGWHGVLMYVNSLLMLPIRALWWLLRAMWSPVGPMWRRAVAWHRPIGFLLTFVLAAAATAVSVVAALPAAVALGGVSLARPAARHADYQADAATVRLGLGNELLAALEHAIETGQADRAEEPGALPMPLVRRAGRLRRTLAAQVARP